MDDSFASLFRSVTSDHSVPDDSWYLQGYEDPSTVSNYHSLQQSNFVHNYSSDSESLGYGTQDLAAESLKENYLSKSPRRCAEKNENENDPFSIRCRIPVPDLLPMSRYHMWLETSFMCKRNERERQRVRNVNDGFSRLRNHLPRTPNMRRRQSKVETLQHAIKYIKQLQDLLEEKRESNGNNQ